MGCRPWCSCCGDKGPARSGTWTREEDDLLISYMQGHKFIRSWNYVLKSAGLHRCGRSCRHRWVHYLNPDIKHDKITEEKEELIIKLHRTAGNSWAEIASELPGITDSDIRNYWRLLKRRT